MPNSKPHGKPLEGIAFCFGPGMQGTATQKLVAGKMRTAGASMIQRPPHPFIPPSFPFIILVDTPNRPYPYTHRLPATYHQYEEREVDWRSLDSVIERFALYDPDRTDVRVMRKEWVDEVLKVGVEAMEDTWALDMYKVVGSRAPPVRAGTSSGGRKGSDREYCVPERAVSVPLPTRVITGRRGEGTKTFLKREVKVEPIIDHINPVRSALDRSARRKEPYSTPRLPNTSSKPSARTEYIKKYGATQIYPNPSDRIDWIVKTLGEYPELRGESNYKWYLMSNEYYSCQQLSRFFFRWKKEINAGVAKYRGSSELSEPPSSD